MRLRDALARHAYLRKLRIPACQLRTLTIRAGADVTLMTADADDDRSCYARECHGALLPNLNLCRSRWDGCWMDRPAAPRRKADNPLVRGAENPQSVRDPPARRSRTIAETTASWP